MTDEVFTQPVKNKTRAWTMPVQATIENSGKAGAPYEVESTLFDQAGKTIAKGKAKGIAAALDQGVTSFNLPVVNPKLWWIEKPTLYHVKTTVKQNGQLVDSLTTYCGFRTVKFTADSGFYLNGKHIKIKGTADHQDHAGAGVAVPNSMWDFRLKKLKDMGVNAYRCAHNPPAAEFLDACDRAGIMVMDENRNINSSADYLPQLQWMIRRDRNHPSIIL
jgi:beta-galactosidase